jgi:transposase
LKEGERVCGGRGQFDNQPLWDFNTILGSLDEAQTTEGIDSVKVAENPNREIHVVLDNLNTHKLNTHKPKEDRWLKRHPNVQLHFTPTYSSWLNQVECCFSILSRQALRGASFTSPRQLRQAIDDFVSVYNQTAAPFEWKKAVVFASKPKSKSSNFMQVGTSTNLRKFA